MTSAVPAQSLIRHLEDNSLSILTDLTLDVRMNGGASLRYVNDNDLQLALYTVLLKIVDILREKSCVNVGDTPSDIASIYVRSIRDLMDYVDGQSSYTAGHTRAVVSHVGRMAALLGLPDEEVENLETAAWIHNIGLINQSHRLETLARTLTQDELRQARNHTVIGAEMIRPIGFLAHLVPIVRHHHDRFDGAGSTERGESIPLGARLICLADAYQAMLEPRAYRPALNRERALFELNKSAGTQFDPMLVPLACELN